MPLRETERQEVVRPGTVDGAGDGAQPPRKAAPVFSFLRSQAARIVAIVILVLVVLWVTARPDYSSTQLDAIASKFRFEERTLVSASNAESKTSFPVPARLAKISAWISSLSAAVAITDVNADGVSDDTCHVDPRQSSVTVAPAPGTGSRYTPFLLDPRPLPFENYMAPMGCTHGDFNEDGRTDFLVYYTGRTPILYLRRPNTEVSTDAYARQELVPGGHRQYWISDTVAQTDVDGDGHNDLLVGNYYRDGARAIDPAAEKDDEFQMPDSLSRAYNGGGLRVFLWEGGRSGDRPGATFREERNALHPDLRTSWVVAIGAGDLTGDRLPEVYLANDMGPDRLLVNESRPDDVKLTAVKGRRDVGTPSSKQLGTDSFKSMSAPFGDLNGDGRLDIFVSNITSEWGLYESNLVWQNTGGKLAPGSPAPYKDVSEEMNVARSGWGWDAKIGDFDNDTQAEIVQAVGYVKGKTNRWPEMQELAMGNDLLLRHLHVWPHFRAEKDDLAGNETNSFFVRGPEGHWADVGERIGMDRPMVSRGVALGDVNRDGRLDYAVANQWRDSYLYLNRSPKRPHLGLTLRLPAGDAKAAKGTTRVLGPKAAGTPTRPALGAQVTVRLPNGKRLVQQVDGGNGHGGFSSQEVLFGLGRNAPERVTADIAWRDGAGVARRTSLTLRPGWHTVLLEQR